MSLSRLNTAHADALFSAQQRDGSAAGALGHRDAVLHARPRAKLPGPSPWKWRWMSCLAKLKIDPVELRLRNYAERDEDKDLPWSSKSLRECYRQGAERFGWARRPPEPRSHERRRPL